MLFRLRAPALHAGSQRRPLRNANAQSPVPGERRKKQAHTGDLAGRDASDSSDRLALRAFSRA
ncbi:MAG: hypothetical protein JNJ60_01890 [Rhodocyclaceae bacterium]|nr:hypothetical protein [Rhodocyclaceae bacterium]